MADARRRSKPTALILRITPAQRWSVCHIIAGLLGAFAVMLEPTAFAAWEDTSAGFLNPMAGFLIYLATVLVVAALPAMIYQAWELAPQTHPISWLGTTILALAAAPALLLAVLLPLLHLAVTAMVVPEAEIVWYAYTVAALAVGALWAAPLQWLPIRSKIGFLRWWKAAGPALGLAAVVVVLGSGLALEDGLIWPYSILFAAIIYGLGTLAAIRSVLGSSG
jgi:hypothetical protein